MTSRFVIFEASGDLATRYLIPAMMSVLESQDGLEDLSILALSRTDWDTSQYRAHVKSKLKDESDPMSKKAQEDLLSRIHYRQITDTGDAEQIREALGSVTELCLFYLALPPSIFDSTVQALGYLNLHKDSRIILEIAVWGEPEISTAFKCAA